jgi:hypothetical protein
VFEPPLLHRRRCYGAGVEGVAPSALSAPTDEVHKRGATGDVAIASKIDYNPSAIVRIQVSIQRIQFSDGAFKWHAAELDQEQADQKVHRVSLSGKGTLTSWNWKQSPRRTA